MLSIGVFGLDIHMLFFLELLIQFLLRLDLLLLGLATLLLIGDGLVSGVSDLRLFVALAAHGLLHDASALKEAYFFVRKFCFLRFMTISWFAINYYINIPQYPPHQSLFPTLFHPFSTFLLFTGMYFFEQC